MFAFADQIVYLAYMAQTLPQAPKHRVPRGYEIVIVDKKPVIRKARGKPPSVRTISFRVESSTYAKLLPFIESFEEREWGVAMRWLLEQEAVKTVISDQVRSAARPARRRTK